MNVRKQTQLLGSQTTLAQKVYECVPLDAMHDLHDIYGVLKAQYSSGASLHAVRACLGALEDQKLIKQPVRNYFQRVAIKELPAKDDTVKPTLASVMPTMKKTVEVSHIPAPPVAPVNLSPAPAAVSAMGLLADISADMYAFAAESHKTLKSLAERISEAALVIEQQRETEAAHMAKVHQLQKLLKEIGGE